MTDYIPFDDLLVETTEQLILTDIEWILPEVDELVEYEDWKAKREQDIAWCGKIETRIKPGTKKIEYYSVPCNEPDCPRCGLRIKNEMKANLGKILEDRPLRKIVLEGTIEQQKTERARIMRKYGKGKVTTAGTDLLTDEGLDLQIEVYIDTPDEIGEECSELTNDDIERFCEKSFNCKHSGSLHKTLKVVVKPDEKKQTEPDVLELESPEPEKKIRCEAWQTDAEDRGMLLDLDLQADLETKHLNPKTFAELIRDLEIWTAARRRIYEENQVVILSNKILRITVKLSEINWEWAGNRRPPG